jgi:hypothetical protein
VRAVLANAEAPMRPTRSDSGQHLVQGVAHRGSLFASSESTAHTRTSNGSRVSAFLPLFVRAQTKASPVRLGSLSDQVPICLECLDGLRCSATGGRLKLRECRWVPEAERIEHLPRAEVPLLTPVRAVARIEGEDVARRRAAPPPTTQRAGVMHVRHAPAYTYAMKIGDANATLFKIGWVV